MRKPSLGGKIARVVSAIWVVLLIVIMISSFKTIDGLTVGKAIQTFIGAALIPFVFGYCSNFRE
mgnify:CR=1 FL=1